MKMTVVTSHTFYPFQPGLMTVEKVDQPIMFFFPKEHKKTKNATQPT